MPNNLCLCIHVTHGEQCESGLYFKTYDKSSPTYSIYTTTYANIRRVTHAIAYFTPCLALSIQRRDYKLKHGC